MVVSEFKSEEEIGYLLDNINRLAVFSCNACANLSGTGGPGGLEIMSRLLKKLGKDVVLSKTVNICCCEEVMAETFRIYLNPVKSDCDAILMLSCAGGVKTAYLRHPGLPIITALDSLGSGAITRKEDLVAQSRCLACGQCVISYTGGICPSHECFSKKKYGPCKKAPQEGDRCTFVDHRLCIWKEIEKRGDLKALKELESFHKSNEAERIAPYRTPASPKRIRRFSGWFMTRIPSIAGLVDKIN
jgi:hypothetical protein